MDPKFEEYKYVEFVGDKFVTAFLSEIFMRDKKNRHEVNALINQASTNDILGKAAVVAGLKPENYNSEIKRLGSAFEHKVGSYVLNEDYIGAKQLIIDYLIPLINNGRVSTYAGTQQKNI